MYMYSRTSLSWRPKGLNEIEISDDAALYEGLSKNRRELAENPRMRGEYYHQKSKWKNSSQFEML